MNWKMVFRSVAVRLVPVVLVFGLCSCATVTPPNGHAVLDTALLDQNPTTYVPAATADQPLLEPGRQNLLAKGLTEALFRPWEQETSAYKSDDIFWGFTAYAKRELFGENTRKRDGQWLEGLRELALVKDYPNAGFPAISVANTSLRVLPTDKPAFYDFSKAGEGFPFDYMQNSALWAGTPVFVSHVSADRDWFLCESRFAAGWVPARDIALVDNGFMAQYRNGDYLALVRDDAPVVDAEGLFRFQGRLGMVLPRDRESQDPVRVLVPVADSHGKAGLVRAEVAPGAATPLPLPLTARNIAALSETLMGDAYGWGGMYGNRDCSATVMDIFIPFGLALPRNSGQQAAAGKFISLKDLESGQKEQYIAANGIPWLTLVRKPGHIMLYVGNAPDGRPLVLHNMWGLRTKDWRGREGRQVVGGTVITTLEPGMEQHLVRQAGGSLLEGVTGITFLAPPEEGGK